MKFDPQTEKEIAEANLYEPGEYDFEVVSSEDAISKKGAEMIKLNLRVFGGDASSKFVNDYLLASMAFKLRHAAECCGLLDKYESGNLEASDFMNKSGRVKIKIDDKKKANAENGTDYPASNVVADYVVDKDPKEQKATTKPLDDFIPF